MDLFLTEWRDCERSITGTDESVAILLKYGAQANAGYTDPIMDAISKESVAKLKTIIKAGMGLEQKHLDEARRVSKANP